MTRRVASEAICVGTLLGLGVAIAASAQNTPPADGPGLEEIVITAQRRTEKLDQVPIAASVISGPELAERGVSTIADLVTQAPSLNVQNTGLLSYVNIRGVGLNSTNPTTSSGVANYSDGFFLPHETAIGDSYYDVGQIEILRGPQGTLVGQSSTGGAIFVNSVKPSFEKLTGYAQQSVGNYGYTRTEGAVNIPLSDTLAVRVAQHLDHRDSFYTNIGAADAGSNHALEPGNQNSLGGRVGIKWLPSSALDVYFKYEYEARNGDGYIGKDYAELAGANNAVDARLSRPFNISYDNPTWDKYRLARVSTEINWNITEAVTLRSLSGYQHEQNRNLFDNDFTYQPLSYANQTFREDTFEQEFNLISNSQGPLNWILGAFYLNDNTPTYLHLYTAPPGPPPEFLIQTQPTERSYAVFGQATYRFTDHWQLLVGARENRNEKSQTGTQTLYNVPTGAPPPAPALIPELVLPLTAELKKTIPSGKVALSFLPDPDSTAYVSASRGFKAGGMNAGNLANLIFQDETIDAYEGGYKASYFDKQVRVSGAAFYYDYNNMQMTAIDSGGQRSIINIPQARIYGAELEMDGQIGASLALNAGASYTRSEVTQQVSLVDSGNPLAGLQDLTGRQLPYAPRWTANAGGTYTIELGQNRLVLTGQYSYASLAYVSLFQLVPRDVIASHGLVNANIAWLFHNGVKLEAYGTNLGDKLYAAGSIGTDAAIWGAPRQYGLRLGVDF